MVKAQGIMLDKFGLWVDECKTAILVLKISV